MEKNRIKLKCDWCRKKFERIPSHIEKHNFCCKECYHNWYSKNCFVKCDFCRKKFQISPSTNKSKHRFCNRKCYGLWRREHDFKKIDLTYNSTLAYILGVLLGDGSVYKSRAKRKNGTYFYNYLIRLKVKDLDFVNEFAENITKIGLKPNIRFNKSKNPNWSDTWTCSSHSKQFYKWYTNLTFSTIKKIVNISDKHRINFIKGFYESEGSFYFSTYFDKRRGKNYMRYCVSIANTNKKLIRLTDFTLKKINFKFNFRAQKNKERKDDYKLYIGKKDVIKEFLELINPVIYRKGWRCYEDFSKSQKLDANFTKSDGGSCDHALWNIFLAW